MRDLGELWKQYQANPDDDWAYEKRIIIDGEVYHEAEIFSSTKQGGLILDDFNIGVCAAMRFDVVLRPKNKELFAENTKENVKVEYQIRIVGSKGNTSWMKFGTYYIDFRKLVDNRLSLECYDSMLYADQPFLKGNEASANYPITADSALERISNAIGVPLDPRNSISSGMAILFPQNLTMREVLGFIASANGCNAYITDDNYLRLIAVRNDAPLNSITSSNAKKTTLSGNLKIDELQIAYNDKKDFYTSGSGGTVLKVFNLFATQELTNKVFNVIKDYTYNSFEAESAEINPALELGDPISVNGMQANLWSVRWSSRLFCDIAAPTMGNTSREFPFGGTSGTLARLAQDGIVQIDHIPTQTEVDSITNEAVVLVYDKNNPFDIVDDRQDVPTDMIIVKGIVYPITHEFVKREILIYPPEPEIDSVVINGADEIQTILGSTITKQYIAEVYNDFGELMLNEQVAWSLDNEYEDITIDSNGLLTVGNKAINGKITIIAVSKSDPSISASFEINIRELVDFAFVIYGNQYTLSRMSGAGSEILNFTVDWGDGTQTNVNSNSSQDHTYPSEKEWTITIKNYISGWIFFYNDTRLRRVLTPFPRNNNRKNFGSCFEYCTNLTSIPENLFANNPNVEYFNYCFSSCEGLITIPKQLFANNPNVIDFSGCFHSCKNLQNINLNFHTNVLNRNVNYTLMFYVDSTINSHKGLAANLWNSATSTTSYKRQCFRNNTALTNYTDIPSEWK